MKLFQKEEWNILWPFYLAEFVYGIFLFFGPYMIIYFLDIGLSFFKISILMSVFTLAILIFEVPTGALADIYGRKKLVILSWILAGISFILLFFTTNFYLIAIILFLSSASITLSSGADQAWIIDLLKHKRKKDLIQDYFIKSSSIGSLSIIFLGILSSLFVKYFGMRGIWIVSGIGTIISSLILINAKEYFKKEEIKLKQIFGKTISKSKESFKYSIKNKNLLFLLLASIFVIIAASANGNMWQPFLRDVGLKPYLLGYIYSLVGAFSIGLPFLSKPLLKKIGKEKYYLIILTVIGLLILLFVYYTNILILALIIFILFNIIDQLELPVKETFFHKIIPSKIRATIGSLKSMLFGIGGTIGLLIGGFLADKFGPQLTIVYSAFFLVPAVIFYLMIKQK